MSTEVLVLSYMIDALECRNVATDPGALLKTDYDKGNIHIKMEVGSELIKN